uniref:Putative collagen alpha-1i chain n=1 Tax=Ixodes ricinus TaxID=34613 RepID=A0A147BQ05_IXORI
MATHIMLLHLNCVLCQARADGRSSLGADRYSDEARRHQAHRLVGRCEAADGPYSGNGAAPARCASGLATGPWGGCRAAAAAGWALPSAGVVVAAQATPFQGRPRTVAGASSSRRRHASPAVRAHGGAVRGAQPPAQDKGSPGEAGIQRLPDPGSPAHGQLGQAGFRAVPGKPEADSSAAALLPEQRGCPSLRVLGHPNEPPRAGGCSGLWRQEPLPEHPAERAQPGAAGAPGRLHQCQPAAGLQGGPQRLHCHPGTPPAHGGRLLGHGVAGTGARHRHDHQPSRRRQGEV